MSGLIQGSSNKKEVQDVEIRLFDLKLIAHDRCEEMKLIKDIEDIVMYEDLEFGGFIIIDGKSYHHCAYHKVKDILIVEPMDCLLYTSPSPRD